jgi:hypothetical protein
MHGIAGGDGRRQQRPAAHIGQEAHMLSHFGPSGLLRLTAMVGIGASLLLAGCATSTHETTQAAADEKEGWTRCDHPRNGGITVVCWKR